MIQLDLSEHITSSDAITGTGNKSFFVPEPLRLVRWGVIAATALDFTASFALRLDKRPTAGTATGVINGWGGAMALEAADNAAAGEVLYGNVSSDLVALPGEEIRFEVTSAGTSGTAYYFVQFQPFPWQKWSPHLSGGQGFPDYDWLKHMTEIPVP